MVYQLQEVDPAELTHCHYRTSGLNLDGSLKHDYPTSEWRLVPLDSGHARQATAKCGRERQEGDRVATGRRQGGNSRTTGEQQESGREATGSDRQATGRRQGR